MPTRLRRQTGTLYVNRERVGYLADQLDREIVVVDDGDADALVMRTALAVGEYITFTDDEVRPADGYTLTPGENTSGRSDARDNAPQLGSTESDEGAAGAAA